LRLDKGGLGENSQQHRVGVGNNVRHAVSVSVSV
jgi:hypothetical protein